MDLLYALVPLSLLLLGIAIAVFFWAVRNGQFDDMDSPAHRILFDDDPADDTSSAQQDKTPAEKP
ncbi:MAG: cbb3-type cytochrome oxidase assembly protein CcoS [Saccharospirillaceae bacterium]|nr:cbb3-type cytochrome oxidase assembly protein CcoS [Saccharospirillaceae bacterium]MCD8532566.1 cbb3-type cytochrome oxidase assembly protein CcoS [Saccharospirillaceae bacterium]